MGRYHCVERDVREFCGWGRLLEIVDRARDSMLKALVAALFETGGRISEVLMLRGENFDLNSNPDFVIVRNMPVVKRGKRKGGGITFSRTFPIKRTDPLWPFLEGWIKQKDPDDLLFPICRSGAFLLVRRLGKDLYPHWFRAQRASQLALEYGWDVSSLCEFFAWKHLPTALIYAHRGYRGLAERMK